MKIFMSRGRFESLCKGLSPVERDNLADQVTLYPEPPPRGWPLHAEIDQDRVGAAFQRLLHDAQLQRHLDQAAAPGIYWHHPKQGGKASYDPGPPWTPMGRGVWMAPAGTPPPPMPAAWADLDTIKTEIDEFPPEPARRYFLNDLATTAPEPPATGDDLRQLMGVYARIADAVPPRRLKAGEEAIAAFTRAYGQGRTPTAALADVAQLARIPILMDPGMDPRAWKLVDPTTGDTLLEGHLDDDRPGRVVRDAKPGDDLFAL